MAALFAVAAPSPGTAADGLSILPDFDTREADKPPPAHQDALEDLTDRLGPTGFADLDPATGGVGFVGRSGGLLGEVDGGSPRAGVLDYVAENRHAFGLDTGDLERLGPVEAYTSIDGVRHLTWEQRSHGIRSYDTYLRANVSADGRLINVSGAPIGDFALADSDPAITAGEALALARRNIGGSRSIPQVAERQGDAEKETRFAGGETARLTAFADETGVRLAWRVQVRDPDRILYEVVVADDGSRILARRSLTYFADQAQIWEPFPDQTSTPQTVDLGADPTWIDRSASGTMLKGNNAHAIAANGSVGIQPEEEIAQVAGDWIFPTQFFNHTGCPAYGCTWDHSQGNALVLSNREQATTTLFYLVNHFHDHLLEPPIGFDEASGNYEHVNSSGDGVGGDALLAVADLRKSNINNAFFAGSEVDGDASEINMFLWRFPDDLHSANSTDIVYHEYAHGLTVRLMSPATQSSFQAAAMGEGWSDFFALDLRVSENPGSDTPADGEVLMGEYLQGPGASIRSQATDCSVGSASPACTNSGPAGNGGYTYGDLGEVAGAAEVHADGEIWTQTLWDLRKALGREPALAVIAGGLRLSPSGPTFLDMRDAILQSARSQGMPTRPIWEVFAERGMGFGAVDDVISTEATDDFTLPGELMHLGTSMEDPPPFGDGDGSADPGEIIEVRSELENVTDSPLLDVAGTMASAGDAVPVGEPESEWPEIAPGSGEENGPPFTATIPASQPCGSTLGFDFTVDPPGTATTIPSLPVAVGAADFFPSPDPALPRTVPDPGSVSSTLSGLPSGTVKHLSVRIGSLEHRFVGDLRIELTHGPTTVVLMDRPGPGVFGSGGDDFSNLVFDDAAAVPIEALPTSSPHDGPYSGTYRPNEPLSAFDGQSQTGTWTLTVADVDAGSAGKLNSWSLSPARECSTTAAPLPRTEGAAAGSVTATSAVLNGSVDPNGNDTSYAFEFGTTTAYGTRTPITPLGSGTEAENITADISGLTPGTTYHYRPLAFMDGALVARGADRTLTTAGGPAPPGGDPLDTDPPETTVTRGPRRQVQKPSAEFRFESSEPGGTFTCRLKGKRASRAQGRSADCDSPKRYRGLDPGRYKFTVFATDAAGNDDPTPAVRSFEVR